MKRERLMETTWLATVACCTALHDIGFDAEDIAAEMPDAMKKLADDIIQHWLPCSTEDAIKAGQDHAERLAAKRSGVTA